VKAAAPEWITAAGTDQQHPAQRSAKLPLPPMKPLDNKESPPVFAYVSIFVLGVLTAAAFAVARDFIVGTSQQEILRVTSPDGAVDAVFVKPRFRSIGDDAVYIVLKGEPVPSRGPQLRGSVFTPPPQLVWRRSHLLQVDYLHGCISGFTNFWHSYDLENGNYYVELVLNPANDFPCVDSAHESSMRNP
jgi:hypothetical protein